MDNRYLWQDSSWYSYFNLKMSKVISLSHHLLLCHPGKEILHHLLQRIFLTLAKVIIYKCKCIILALLLQTNQWLPISHRAKSKSLPRLTKLSSLHHAFLVSSSMSLASFLNCAVYLLSLACPSMSCFNPPTLPQAPADQTEGASQLCVWPSGFQLVLATEEHLRGRGKMKYTVRVHNPLPSSPGLMPANTALKSQSPLL